MLDARLLEQEQYSREPPQMYASAGERSAGERSAGERTPRNGVLIDANTQHTQTQHTQHTQHTQLSKGGIKADGVAAADAILVSVKVPSGAAGLVVGKKGTNIKRFKDQAGVRLSLPQGETAEKNLAHKTVELEGPRRNVEKGLVLLAETLSAWAEKDETGTAECQGAEAWHNALFATLQEHSKQPKLAQKNKKDVAEAEFNSVQVRMRLIIPLAGAGMVVGKQGKTIKTINVKTGAHAALAKDPLDHDPSRKELIIQGTRAQAYKCKDEVLTVMLQWLRNAPEEPGGGPGASYPTASLRAHMSLNSSTDSDAAAQAPRSTRLCA